MKICFIITNHDKDKDLTITKGIREYLTAHGCECYIQEKNETGDGENGYGFHFSQMPESVEGIIVLGGDGTLIQAAHDIAANAVPLLGINIGTLGYLTEIGRDDIETALDALLHNRFEIEERMMLEGKIIRRENAIQRTDILDNKEERTLALNDIVLNRIGALRVVHYHVYVNEKYLTTYRADGVIVATPTGSTGYSMSAGGPIIAPCSQMCVITPICSHTLNNRSIVLEAADRIKICVESEHAMHHPEAVVNFDAVHSMELDGGDCIEICKSHAVTKMIKITKGSFLQNLGKKLMY